MYFGSVPALVLYLEDPHLIRGVVLGAVTAATLSVTPFAIIGLLGLHALIRG
jgi:hypothetical protein